MKATHNEMFASALDRFFARSPVTLMLGLAILAVSCAHSQKYVEPALGEDTTAFLEAFEPAWVYSLDDQRVPYRIAGDRRRLRIAPGPHRVKVFHHSLEIGREMNWGRDEGLAAAAPGNFVTLAFTASPGATYRIVDGRNGDQWAPSIHESLPAP